MAPAPSIHPIESYERGDAVSGELYLVPLPDSQARESSSSPALSTVTLCSSS
jgi:hypothetical protein